MASSSSSSLPQPAAAAPRVANPESGAGFLSQLTMAFIWPLLMRGARAPLENEDLGEVLPQDKASALAERFRGEWARELAEVAAADAKAETSTSTSTAASLAAATNSAAAAPSAAPASPPRSSAPPSAAPHRRPRPAPSIARALRRTLGWSWLWAIVAFCVGSACSFLPPLILKELVAHLQGAPGAALSPARLWLDVVGMFAAPAVNTLLTTYHNNVMARVGTQLRTALTMAIYAKAVVLRPSAEWTAGEVLTRMSVDAALPLRFVAFASQILVAPPTIAAALWLIYRDIGASVFAGLGFLLVAMPLSGMLVARLFGWRRESMLLTDRRTKLTVEAIAGIRVVKMNAWEAPIVAQITEVRERE